MATSGANNEAQQTSRESETIDTSYPYNVADGWGSNVLLHNDRVIVTDEPSSPTNAGIARRLNEARGIDYDILQEHIDDTIYELIPTPPPLPNKPPESGREPDGRGYWVNKLIVANWYDIYESGGSTNPEKDVHAGWTRRWAHDRPARYGINPKYRFYTGDNPLFYIYNPTSHYDPNLSTADGHDGWKSIFQRVLPDSIIWKINGQEVHRGNYLQLFNVKKADAEKLLTVDINNAAGTLSQTIMFEIKDSDDFGDEESLSAKYQGFFSYNPTIDSNRGKAEWREDPRYQPRRVKFQIHWNNYGNGKNKKRNFNDRKPSIKIDGVQMVNNLVDENGNLIDIPNGVYAEQGRLDYVEDKWIRSAYTFYFEKPPGPLSLEIYTDFNIVKSWKRKKRRFYRNYEYTIDLDSSLDDVIDLGIINVGSEDGDR
jgi:hypothetical protein